MDPTQPIRRVIRTPRDAEVAARDWLAYFGFDDSRLTIVGPDEGIDVVSAEMVAQVKATDGPVGRPVVQQIYGVASLEGKQAFLFTVAGVTKQAREWADRAGVVLFRLDDAGEVAAENSAAEDVLASADRKAVGWAAVRAELEALLAEGKPAEINAEFELVNGRIGFWSIGHDGNEVWLTDFVGSRTERAESVAAAVGRVAAGIRQLGGTYNDCRPFLVVDGQRRRFFPRFRYATPETLPPVTPAAKPVERARSVQATVRVTASDVYAALSGSQCERRVYLEAHGVDGSPPSLLEEMLWGLGAEHEKNHLQRLPDALDLSGGTAEERLEATRRALDAGTPAIYQPLFRSSATVNGSSCEIVGQPDFVLARGDRHVIRDTKAATRVDERERPDIAGQLRLYGWLYEQTTGQPPKALEVLNGHDELHEIDYEGWRQLEPTLRRIVALKTAEHDPYCAVKTSNRSCPYFERCWSEAIERNAISTIPGMLSDLAERLHDQGIESIADLVRSHTLESLAEIKVTIGDRQQRVGSRAERILRSASSLLTGEVIQIAPLDLPATEHTVMFDLEGIPALGGGESLIYLWGTEVNGPSPTPYMAAFAEPGPDPGRQGWRTFLERAAALFETYGPNLPFVHWASYERTQLRAHINLYGDPDRVGARVLDNLLDLLQVVRRSLVLPVHSYSLKTIEQYVGFERSQAEYGGDWSIAKWEEAVACQDPAARAALLDQLATYNREDCDATWAVYDWLHRFER